MAKGRGFSFLLGFATAVGVGYLAYRALLALPDFQEAAEERTGQLQKAIRKH